MNITGKWTVWEKRRGVMVPVGVSYNSFTSAGRELLAQIIGGGSGGHPQYMAFGTSNAAATTTQTDIVAEVVRAQVTSRSFSGSVATIGYIMPTGTGNGNTFHEVGLFNSASGGKMFNRSVLSSGYVKTNQKSPLFTVSIDFDP